MVGQEGPKDETMSPRPAADTREQIVSAAARLIQERGLSAATTRAIAEAARCAEGSIYRHFPHKHALLLEIVRTRFPEFFELVLSLPDRAGTGTVRKNLEEVAAGALAFYRGVVPLVAGVMADRELLEEQRRFFRVQDVGPHKVLAALAAYVRSEQRLGRLSARAKPGAAARLLLGACFVEAYLSEVLGRPATEAEDARFVREMVRTLLVGLSRKE